ncbi:hypothetical protein ZWY2020_007750 [Hordeum vulgare]|nr:hypothetical protein ZWY2020_007750 [Hordeum vulgare]
MVKHMRAVKRPSRPESLPSNADGEAQPTGEASEKIQALLERDEGILTIEGAEYFFSLPLSAAPGNDRFWSYCSEQQLNELNHRLALYRLKDYKQLHLGKEEDIAELKVKYPLHVLQSEFYFEHLEKSLEWYFHPEHTKIAGLDDYQRLVLQNDNNYVDWDSYCLTYHTYQGDLDYVKYCDRMMEEIKWIEDKVGHDVKQWQRYERRACFLAVKIGSRFGSSLYRHSVMRAYNDYIESVRFDFVTRKDFDRLFLEIWKRVAKQKVDYYCALEEIYQKKLFPLLMGQIKLEIEKLPPSFHGWMKKKYDTYVACIDEKISEEDCHLLIKGSMKKMFPEPKTYLDYARKKMDIAVRIGLIPKASCVDLTTEGREDSGEDTEGD